MWSDVTQWLPTLFNISAEYSEKKVGVDSKSEYVADSAYDDGAAFIWARLRELPHRVGSTQCDSQCDTSSASI